MYQSLFTVTRAFVLKRSNYSETDKILLLYTRELGKIRVLAKGIRRITSRRASFVELFRESIITIRNSKSMLLLSEASSANPEKYTLSLAKMSALYFLMEVIDKIIPERVVQQDLYDVIISEMNIIVQLDDSQVFTRAYALSVKLLRFLGFINEKTVLSEEELVTFIERISEKRFKSRVLLT